MYYEVTAICSAPLFSHMQKTGFLMTRLIYYQTLSYIISALSDYFVPIFGIYTAPCFIKVAKWHVSIERPRVKYSPAEVTNPAHGMYCSGPNLSSWEE